MAYRNEDRALRERRDNLLLRVREAQRDERSAQEARTSAAEEAQVDEKQGRRLPLLDNVRIASPCNVSWEKMRGDARKRFCGQCNKNVYNLSEMTRDEAESFLVSQEVAPCVRMYQRADGTLLTSDCPSQRRRRALLAAGGGVASLVLAVAGWFGSSLGFRGVRTTQGEMPMQHTPAVMGTASAHDDSPAPYREIGTPATGSVPKAEVIP